MRFEYETPSLVQIGSFAVDTGFLWTRRAADPVTGWKDTQ